MVHAPGRGHGHGRARVRRREHAQRHEAGEHLLGPQRVQAEPRVRGPRPTAADPARVRAAPRRPLLVLPGPRRGITSVRLRGYHTSI